MKRNFIAIASILLPVISYAQSPFTASQYMKAYPVSVTQVIYGVNTDINTCNIPAEPIRWGLDAAWISDDNVTRGTNWIGKDVLSIGRVSFQPSDLVDANGNLSSAQQATLKKRLNSIYISGVRDIILNCDHEVLMNAEAYPNCAKNYANYNNKPYEWYRVIKASVLYCRNQGFNVITVSPFNEPDYTEWKEGTVAQFKEIAKYITEDPDLKGIRVSAGNTLNCDQALNWYNGVLPYATEGNTHQLAGSFNNYASFWEKVRKDGNYATADELHNVGEAFIGAHYGMQNGVWWGFEAGARGEYCRASYFGKEIGYAENRNAWNAAAVYKWDDPIYKGISTPMATSSTVTAFIGSSERQATTSAYEFCNIDRPAYYDGVGPANNYYMNVPGGTGYQKGQTNAERMIQVSYGEDVPCEPITGGTFVIMNRNSKKCLGYCGNVTSSGTKLALRSYSGTNSTKRNQWKVQPISERGAADYSYFYLENEETGQYADLLNWGTAPNVNICGYKGGLGANELWVAVYAGNGDYFIRSKHSGLYLEVLQNKTSQDALIVQNTFSGSNNQRWRFMPVNARLETNAPAAPTNLSVETVASSVRLTWTPNEDTDMAGYMIQRSADGIEWDVIGRMVTETEFLDNTAIAGKEYKYRVKAVDVSRNISAASEPSSSVFVPTASQLVASYSFDKALTDASANLYNAVAPADPSFSSIDKKEGENSLTLNGTSSYLMIPPAAVAHKELTITFWAKSTSTASWQRVFDFGNGTGQYMFLTLNNGTELRFVMKNGGEEQILSSSKSSANVWHHYAITIADNAVRLYIDGAEKAVTTDITIRPTDINPVLCYIGRSQYAADPLFKGYLDDMRIYNYPLTAEDVAEVYAGNAPSAIENVEKEQNSTIYNINGVKLGQMRKGFNIINGRKILKK